MGFINKANNTIFLEGQSPTLIFYRRVVFRTLSISKMERFVKTGDGFQSLTFVAKRSVFHLQFSEIVFL